jgi:hypothetical protein
MATRFHSILDQVDGVTSTFEIPEPYKAGSAVLAYNGQIYDPGVNIQAEGNQDNPPTVTLTFTPELDTHTLMIIYQSVDDLENVRGFTHPPGGLLNDY